MLRRHVITILILLPVPIIIVFGVGLNSLKGSVVLLKDIVSTFFYNYDVERKHDMSKIDSILGAFTLAIRKMLPSATTVLPVEETLPNGAYLCASDGYVTNIQTLTKSGKIDYVHYEDGSTDVRLYCHVDDFKLVFQRFHFETGTTQITGNISISFGRNTIVAQLHVPYLGSALVNIVETPCLLFVKSFDITDLGDVDVVIRNEKWSISKLKKVTDLDEAYLVEMMRKEVFKEFYNALPTNAVCKHANLDLQAQSYAVDRELKEYTDKFKAHCASNTLNTGEDN